MACFFLLSGIIMGSSGNLIISYVGPGFVKALLRFRLSLGSKVLRGSAGFEIYASARVWRPLCILQPSYHLSDL